MSETIENIEFEIEGLTLLSRGHSIMASLGKSNGEIVWHEGQLRNYDYLLKKAKAKLEKEKLDDFNAS